jgi:hypothetical protein
MASNENGKIGCSAGRAKIVDPNDFDGFKSGDNVPVQLEDLTISVVLKSFRKGRTLLTTDDKGGTVESIGQIQVNFIEGSDIGSSDGKKVLTTKYTDLTTSFDKGTINDETLGITNIDIEFNPSMAPMVTINFIDVRGSSIFQNEEEILNNRGNKYTTFFQMPYPMFELEVKGYYGMPVKYCLHMLKFNSKFNSRTGNFEITCNFIGYTFALMSDMLIGYLKAIPFTNIGKEQFELYNSTISGDRKVTTLVDLSSNIRRINEGIAKTSSDNPAAQEISTISQAVEKLDGIKGQINMLGQHFDLNKSKELYTYIVYNHKDKFSSSDENALNSLYKEKVKELVAEYNKLSSIEPLVEADFVNIDTTTNTKGGKLYKKITVKQLKESDDPTLKLNMGNPSDFTVIKDKVLKHIETFNTDPKIGDGAELDVFDMTLLFDKIEKAKKALEVKETSSKTELAKAFETEVRESIGFDPTARRIVEHFTAAIEVLIESIFRVSQAASINTERTDELAKKFIDDGKIISKDTDLYGSDIKIKQFFPWPDYRELKSVENKSNTDSSAQNQTYVEKYLGASGVNVSKINELVFIDDLLQAFRKAAQADIDAAAEEAKAETTWYPVSPLDTKIFTDKEPYERDELKQAEDVARLVMIRAMTFLGYSNDKSVLQKENVELLAMANAEVDAILRGVKDAVLKQSLTQLTDEFFLTINGSVNPVSDSDLNARPVVVKDSNGDYKYNYIYKDNELKLIPINKGFNKEKWGFPTYDDKTKELTNTFRASLITKRDDEKFYFLTNYNDSNLTSTQYKKDDGGTYIQILDVESLPTPVALISTLEGVTTESTMVLEKLQSDSVDSSAGYNSFGGDYGIQEFKTMDWGADKTIEGLPLMYVFYRDCDTGLALTREASGNKKKLEGDTVSPFSYNGKNKLKWAEDKRDVYQSSNDGKPPVHVSTGKNRSLFKELREGKASDITYPYIELKYGDMRGLGGSDEEPRQAGDGNSFSLFGSDLYYNQSYARIKTSNGTKIQCTDYSRALLFLQTLPFNYPQNASLLNNLAGNPFQPKEIRRLFNKKAGLIHAPKLWCAYIGSILWRRDESNPELDGDVITGGGSGKEDPIVWSVNYSSGVLNATNEDDSVWDIPNRNSQYFPPVLDLDGGSNNITYPDIEDNDVIRHLPSQVKKEFKRIFFDFVNGNSGTKWEDLYSKLEIFKRVDKYDGKNFRNYINKVYSENNVNVSIYNPISTEELINGTIGNGNYDTNVENIKANYDVIIPVDYLTNFNRFYLHLQLKDKSDAVTAIIQALNEEVVIANTNYKIWLAGALGLPTTERSPITVSGADLKLYIETLNKKLTDKADEYNIAKKNENLDVTVFGTSNTDVIKLQLYRNCKNIYDKWLGGAQSIDKLVFQCGGRSSVDSALAEKYQNTKTRMIDSFRFVSRNFKDIGDSLYINPIPINNYLIDNPNTSSYDVIGSVLAANNFNFQALPNFINFNSEENLKAIFKPYSYYDESLSGSCGPAFVCVYAGQSSKHLDFRDGNYPNDGFDLRCMNGDVDISVPKDFTAEPYAAYEDPIGTFMVRYSQQNQNIFKDITLDQSEFSETDESIKIQGEIAQKGSENNRAIMGQNVYNVYAVRSYTAQVEMMGNAMIQPMMYFQLDNIPMFHGAYLITNVSHSITPNNMSTNFSGTRIRYPETPLITAYDVYMDLIETLDLSDAGTSQVGNSGGNGARPVSSPPILQTLIDNGCSGSNINSGNIKACKVEKMTGIEFMLNPNTQMICEAVEPLKQMMKDWVAWMVKEKFKAPGQNKSYAYITSMFRTNGSSSMHAYGLAVDFQFFDKDGNIFRNQEENVTNVKNAFNFTKNPSLKWLYNHAYEYGFVQPYWANDGNSVGSSDGEEWWHWEYHGKAAIYQLRNRPIPAVGGNKASDNPLSEIKESKIKSFVHNPKGKDGKESVYTDMNYKTTAVSDKANKIYTSVSDYPKGPVTVKDQSIPSLNAGTLSFYTKLLDKLGAPKTDGNKFILMAWSQIENPSCNWNAFSTKQPYGGSVACINSGVNKNVQSFNNIDDGVGAAYKTLMNGNYPNLVAALKSGIKTKQDAYNVAVVLQQAPKGDFCVWKNGGIGCKNSNGVPPNTYIAQILSTGKMSGKNIAGSK